MHWGLPRVLYAYCIMFLMSSLIAKKYGQTQRYFCAFGM
jgi:hypothetical protein